ncbi:MAG TPA: cell envelope integrity protein CreD [Burkholderiales bacterium]|nr:cell envelope integrity protein CreD [Burkholderiales bacterium]
MERAQALKTLVIAGLALALLVPVAMIRDLIGERQARRNDAVHGIAEGWGRRQALVGPFLAIPYERSWTDIQRDTVDGKDRVRRVERSESQVARIPVETLDWQVDAATQEKARGIYKARLYVARIQAQGTLVIPANLGVGEADVRIRWGKPRLALGVADPRGLRSVSALALDGATYEFLPGAGDRVLAAGVHAPIDLPLPGQARRLAFRFSLELAGSEAFAIAPLARQTAVAMRADWAHPSFQGVFLPARHELRDDGFSAHWQVSWYAAQGAERLAACRREPCPVLSAPELAVSFIEPVSLYQRLERASKYGFLFIGLTFTAFFFLELLRRLAIHPIQYALVGLALAIFFLLLTALSEHLAFGLAYAIATLACTGLLAIYLARVLQNRAHGVAFGTALGGLFGALYLLVQAEDYALLGGALLLFALLASAMLATRRLDWYRLTRRQAPAATSAASVP